MKKFLTILLTAVMLISMFAVSGSAEELEHVTLKIILGGTKLEYTDKVYEAIAEKYADKLNCDFDVQFVDFGDLNQKLLMKLGANESWDLNFDSNWTGYYTMLAQEGYMDLSELLPVYAPNLYAAYQASGALAAATDNEGRITALPWTMNMNHRIWFRWRGDLADKAGLSYDIESLSTFEDAYKIMSDLHEAYPDKYICEGISLEGFLTKYNLYDIGHGLCFDLTDPECKLIPVEQTDAYKECAEWSKKLFDEGIIWADCTVDGHDGNAYWSEGKMIACATSTHEFNLVQRHMTEEDTRTDYFMLYPDNYYPNRTPLANALAIPVTAENPERVLMFLDLLETEQEMYDLLHYGILDETYVLNDDGSTDYPEGMDPQNSNYLEWGSRWAFWKPQFMRPTFDYPGTFWADEAEFAVSHEGNVVSALVGFNPNLDNISVEIAQRDQIYGDAQKVVTHGLMAEPGTFVDDTIESLKDADLDVILTEIQGQVDVYLGK